MQDNDTRVYNLTTAFRWIRDQRIPRLLKVLDLELGFTPKQLKETYKRKAMQHHPDRGGSERKFEQVTTAYTELRKLIA